MTCDPLVGGGRLLSAESEKRLEGGHRVEARLKWPNDVLAGGGKLAGIPAAVEGRAVDIDADGALLVETGAGTVRLVAGDAHFIQER